MFENEITEIIDDLGETIANILNERVEDYPESVLIVTLLTVDTVTLEWFDENKPLAFNKILFM